MPRNWWTACTIRIRWSCKLATTSESNKFASIVIMLWQLNNSNYQLIHRKYQSNFRFIIKRISMVEFMFSLSSIKFLVIKSDLESTIKMSFDCTHFLFNSRKMSSSCEIESKAKTSQPWYSSSSCVIKAIFRKWKTNICVDSNHI